MVYTLTQCETAFVSSCPERLILLTYPVCSFPLCLWKSWFLNFVSFFPLWNREDFMFCLFFFYSCVCCVLRNTIMVYELCVFTSEVENSFSVCAQRSVVSTWTYFFRGESLRIILVPKSKFCFHLHCGKRKKCLQFSEISMVFFSTNQALGTGSQEAIPLAPIGFPM